MRRCNELAIEAAKAGDLPFGSVVVKDGTIIGEGSNILQQSNVIDGHAERIALTIAQKKLDSRTLENCVVYTNVEPCPMCSFAIRELKISRVVYGLESPVMGGYRKFGVLNDEELFEKIPDYFGHVPEIEPGFLKEEVSKVWEECVPEIYTSFKERGILG